MSRAGRLSLIGELGEFDTVRSRTHPQKERVLHAWPILPPYYSLGLSVSTGCVPLLFSFQATLSWSLVLSSAWG